MTPDLANLRVKYSCFFCGLVAVSCDVPARGHEDVVAWTKEVMIVALAADHAKRSPNCTGGSPQNIMIPITGADRIGEAPRD